MASGGCGGSTSCTAPHAEGYGQSPRGMACLSVNGNAQTTQQLRQFASEARSLSERARNIADPCEVRYRTETTAAIRQWAREASEAGAAVAHRWTRIPEIWRPETVDLEVDGVTTTTADLGAAVAEEEKKWAALWSPAGLLQGSCTQVPAVDRHRHRGNVAS